MSFTLFSVAVLLIFVTAASIEIFRGLRRGYMKTLISLGTVLFSILFSAVLSPLLAKPIVGAVWKSVRNMSFVPDVIRDSYEYSLLIVMLSCIVVSTVLFVALFFIIRGITELVLSIVYRSVLKKRKDDPEYRKENLSWLDRNGRTVSVVAAIISAFLITSVLTSPLMGSMETAVYVVETVEEFDERTLKKVKGADQVIEQLEHHSKDLAGNLFYQLGGKQMYRAAASTSHGGVTVYLHDELALLRSTVKELSAVYPSFSNPMGTTKEQLESMDVICENIKEMGMSHLLVSELFSDISEAWLNGDVYSGIAKPDFNDVIEPTLDEILIVCAETNENSVKANVITLLKVYSLILRSDILGLNVDSYDELMAFFEDGTLIEELKLVLGENPYMSAVIDRIPSIVIDVLADHINIWEFGQEKYDLLMENMADALRNVLTRGYGTSEERLDVLSNYAQDYLNDYGLEVPDTAVEIVADQLLTSAIPEDGMITAETIKDFFGKYGR